MGNQSKIRGSFVRSYAEKHREYIENGRSLIEKRDNEYRILNREYGFVERDGSVSIGCKSSVNIQYKKKYDEIESRFRIPYDRNLPGLYDWCKREGMTVFEYLFIDNLYDEDLESIAAESSEKQDWELDYVGKKAHLLIQKLSATHSVGEIKRIIDTELRDHRYATVRCRRILNVKPWDLMMQKALLDYRRKWKSALEDSFSRQRIDGS